MFCDWIVVPPSPVSLWRVDHIVSGVLVDVVVRKSVWMTNRAALFARSIQCLSLTVMVMMSSMNPSIDASVDVMSTDKGSAVVRWLAE